MSRFDAATGEPGRTGWCAHVGYSTDAPALARYRAGRYPVSVGSGLSPKTTANIHIMLRAAFNDAASKARNVIAESPVPHASRPRVPRARRRTWKPVELTALHRAARDERLYAMWLLFATSGVPYDTREMPRPAERHLVIVARDRLVTLI